MLPARPDQSGDPTKTTSTRSMRRSAVLELLAERGLLSLDERSSS